MQPSFHQHKWGSCAKLADTDIDDEDESDEVVSAVGDNDNDSKVVNVVKSTVMKDEDADVATARSVCNCKTHQTGCIIRGGGSSLDRTNLTSDQETTSSSGGSDAAMWNAGGDDEGADDDGGTHMLCGVCGLPEEDTQCYTNTTSNDVRAPSSASKPSTPNCVTTGSEGGLDDAFSVKAANNPVMVNFRELLWYWREYYLRRGRDRLSIEFSSHIPFRHWNNLVGK